MRASTPFGLAFPGRAFYRAIGLVILMSVLFGCDYARMRNDDAVNPLQAEMPEMPKRAMPVTGGVNELRDMNPDELENPFPATPEVIAMGAERYKFYCIQCHGASGRGQGTVGQSFAPLPTNLRSIDVQDHSDGLLFKKISLGWRRHPPMVDTVSEDEHWLIIRYIRSLSGSPQG
jgi:mono/diheme cytochrome c family protein